MFEVLYEANKHRGVFASSICTLHKRKTNKEKVSVRKSNKEFNFNSKVKVLDSNACYFLGHVQAPTSRKQVFEEDTSHPFETEDWLVAHNGVLTNFQALNKKYCVMNDNPVDTSIIVNMLQDEFIVTKEKEEVNVISTVLSRLEGTFACYIVNKLTKSVFIVRQGSTLFFNDKGDFSSVKGLTMKEVPEGEIYQITPGVGVTKVGMFKVKSPFFVI